MVFFTLHVWFARVQCSEISKLLKCAGRISEILNAIVTMQLFGEIPFVVLWEKCCVLISSKKLLSLIGKLDKFQIVVLPKTRSFGWNRISFTFVGICQIFPFEILPWLSLWLKKPHVLRIKLRSLFIWYSFLANISGFSLLGWRLTKLCV